MPTLLEPLQRANFDHWTRDSACYTPLSEHFRFFLLCSMFQEPLVEPDESLNPTPSLIFFNANMFLVKYVLCQA
jgi:hypothetical protein